MDITVIFGGTFNPFHIGHYQMLDALNQIEEICKIYVVPTKIPPHKSCANLAPDKQRIEMCRIAAKDFEKAEVSLIEFEREGKSYTFDTIKTLKKRYPNEKFFLACGGDMIISLNHWYKWEELIKEVGIFAFRRDNDDDFDKAVENLKSFGADIRVLNNKITDVSSTEIRSKLSVGESTDLLPFAVNEYIIKGKIYYDSDNS